MKAMLEALGVGNMPLTINGTPVSLLMASISQEQKFCNRLIQILMQMRSEDPAFILGIRASQRRIEDLLLRLAEHGVLVDALNDIKEGKFDFSQFIKKEDASTTEAG